MQCTIAQKQRLPRRKEKSRECEEHSVLEDSKWRLALSVTTLSWRQKLVHELIIEYTWWLITVTATLHICSILEKKLFFSTIITWWRCTTVVIPEFPHGGNAGSCFSWCSENPSSARRGKKWMRKQRKVLVSPPLVKRGFHPFPFEEDEERKRRSETWGLGWKPEEGLCCDAILWQSPSGIQGTSKVASDNDILLSDKFELSQRTYECEV